MTREKIYMLSNLFETHDDAAKDFIWCDYWSEIKCKWSIWIKSCFESKWNEKRRKTKKKCDFFKSFSNAICVNQGELITLYHFLLVFSKSWYINQVFKKSLNVIKIMSIKEATNVPDYYAKEYGLLNLFEKLNI